MRVLIADDSVVMRMILERGLRGAGMEAAEIDHASDGMEALVRIEDRERRGEGFDLILSDVHMPVMDGPVLVRELRRRGLAQGVPLVLITAEDASAVPEMVIPGVGRLKKPFTMEQMQASLRPLLGVAAHG